VQLKKSVVLGIPTMPKGKPNPKPATPPAV
jgi:hypothetical protein